MLKQLLISLFFLTATLAYSQPAIQWQNVYGGIKNDEGISVRKGIILPGPYQTIFSAGNSTSGQTGTLNPSPYGSSDIYIASHEDVSGTVGTEKFVGTSKNDYLSGMENTIDGNNLIFTGYTDDYDTVAPNVYNYDGFLFKQNYNLNSPVTWFKKFGGWGNDYARAVCATSDGGYVVVGTSNSDTLNGVWAGNHGDYDFWVTKFDGSGNILWQRSFGGSGYDEARTVVEAADNNSYYIGGYSKSSDKQVGANKGGSDIWLVQVTTAGTLIFSQNYGGSGDDICNSMKVTPDGGYILVGTSTSNDGDITGDHRGATNLEDGWALKLSVARAVQWKKSYGGTRLDGFNDVIISSDNNYVVGGYSASTDGDVVARHATVNGSDAWVMKLNAAANGAILWQKPMGSSFDERANSVIEYYDGGFIFNGYTDLPAEQAYNKLTDDVNPYLNLETDPNVNNNHDDNGIATGGKDFWLVKVGGNCSTPLVDIDVAGKNPVDSVCANTVVPFKAINTNYYVNLITDYHWFINGTDTADVRDTAFLFSNPGTYTITLVANKGVGCVSPTPGSKTLYVRPNPASPQIISSNSFSICKDASTVFSTQASAKYMWYQDAQIFDSTATLNIIGDQSHKYRVKVTNASGCSATSGDTTLIVNQNPAKNPIYAPKTRFCLGDTVILSAPTGDYSYAWAPIVSTNSAINVSASGDYFATITDLNGCSTKLDSISIVVDSLPIVTLTTTTPPYNLPANLCAGDSISLIANPLNVGMTFVWSTSQLQDSIIVKVTDTISVVGTDSHGCQGTDKTRVLVHNKPTPVISPADTAICKGNSVDLVLNNAYIKYAWYKDSLDLGATSAFMSTDSTGHYTVKVTDVFGCTGIAPFNNVLVHELPDTKISLFGKDSLCSYDSVIVGAQPGMKYLWNTGNPADTLQLLTAKASGTYNCVLTQYGCSNVTADKAIYFYPLTNVTVDHATPIKFCEGDSVKLYASPNLIQSYWSNGLVDDTLLLRKSYAVSLYGVDINGCHTDTASVQVIVDSLPKAKIVGPTAFCKGGSALLSVNSPGSTFQWSNNAVTSNIYASTEGTYYVTVTTSDGCKGIGNAYLAEESMLRNVAIKAVGDTVFCQGATVTLMDITGESGAKYQWSTGTQDVANYITVNQSGVYHVTVTNRAGCSGVSNDITVDVRTTPTVAISPLSATSFCKGDSVTLTATPGFASYKWFSSGEVTQNIVVKESMSDMYVLVAGSNGCYNLSNKISVIVYDLPKVKITSTNKPEFCEGKSIVISATGADLQSYDWSDFSTSASVTVKESGKYTVTVTNSFGCSAASLPYTTIMDALPPVPVITVQLQLLSSSAKSNNQWYFNNTVIDSASNSSYLAKKTGAYKVRVTNEHGCFSESLPVTVTVMSGVEDISLTRSLSIFPNPFTDKLNINYSLTHTTDVSIEVYDLSGQRVASLLDRQKQTEGEYQFKYEPGENLNAGAYILKITAGNTVYTSRIIQTK